MALKDIKTKIKATERMHKVTRAMEAVSAVKMRKTQVAALGGRAYARAALSVLTRLSGSHLAFDHPLAAQRDGDRLALLVITSDKGLAGALNGSVLRRAAALVAGTDPADVTVFAYGKKADEYFSRRGYAVARAIPNKSDEVSAAETEDIAAALAAGYAAGDYDRVMAVYSNFKSTFEQVATERQLFPLSLPALSEIVAGILPAKGKWADEPVTEAPAEYAVDDAADGSVLDLLVPKLVAAAVYHMLLESKASEHSARMVAMKNASDKSKEVGRLLTRRYNKVRQAAITREVTEIVSGREALAA